MPTRNARRRPAKKPAKSEPKQTPLFVRGDLVQLIGIGGPVMLVAMVSNEPADVDTYEYEDEDETEEKTEVTAAASGREYMVGVLYLDKEGKIVQPDYDGTDIHEGLLQLVKPAALVLAEAKASTETARNHY